MKVVRLKKGQNDFALANLTVLHLQTIADALRSAGYGDNTSDPSEIAYREIEDAIKAAKLQTLQLFGDELVGKVRPKGWVKKSEREAPKHRDPNLGLKYSVNPPHQKIQNDEEFWDRQSAPQKSQN